MTLEQLDAAFQQLDKQMAELPYEERKRENVPWSRISRMHRAQYRLLKRIAEAKGGKLIFLVGEWICWDSSDNNYSDNIVFVTTDEQQADDFVAEHNKSLHKQFGEEGAGCYTSVAADGYAPISSVGEEFVIKGPEEEEEVCT